jgi:hypothetical protein
MTVARVYSLWNSSVTKLLCLVFPLLQTSLHWLRIVIYASTHLKSIFPKSPLSHARECAPADNASPTAYSYRSTRQSTDSSACPRATGRRLGGLGIRCSPRTAFLRHGSVRFRFCSLKVGRARARQAQRQIGPNAPGACSTVWITRAP